MPGSGPIDPTVPVDFCHLANVTWQSNHLVQGTVAYWLTVNETANAWATTTGAAIVIDQDTFEILKAATVQGNKVLYAGRKFTLDPVTVSGVTWATLQPA